MVSAFFQIKKALFISKQSQLPKQFYFTNLILPIIEILRKAIYTFRYFSAGIIPLCFVMRTVIRRQTC